MFNLKITTPEGVYFEDDITSISLPTLDGTQTILANHMTIIIPLEIGLCTIRQEDSVERYALSSGLFAFEDNQASLIVNTIESSSEIDFQRAQRAHERAKDILQRQSSSEEIKDAELALKRSLVRMRLENEKGFK